MRIIGGEYLSAISIISSFGVRITAELAEELTPNSSCSKRKEIVRELAQCLCSQQEYELACAKYTQCGDKMEAIKCLICAGDTNKVICYASKCKKNTAVSIFAANYLQSFGTQYTKHIVQFYSGAKAYQQLAAFYDAMAQIEIDEYRDYDKALRALKQAAKQLKRAKTNDHELTQRISLVNRFCCARKCAESDPMKMIGICESLIGSEDHLECAVRRGDVYALLVEYYHSCGDDKEAYRVVQRMLQKKIILEPYLDKNMLKKIYDVVGAAVVELQPQLIAEQESAIEEEEDICDDDDAQSD
eukprot:290747_1